MSSCYGFVWLGIFWAVKGSLGSCFCTSPCRSLPSLPRVSRRPILSEPAENLRRLPNLFSHSSIDEDTFRLVWGFATKTRLQFAFLSLSFCVLWVFFWGQWLAPGQTTSPLGALISPQSGAGMPGFCWHWYSGRTPQGTHLEPSFFSVKEEKVLHVWKTGAHWQGFTCLAGLLSTAYVVCCPGLTQPCWANFPMRADLGV